MASPTFRSILRSAANSEVVIPALRSALWDPDFKGFTIEVGGFVTRPPDGWFHPSTHPLWEPRALYQDLTDPESLGNEPFDPQSTIAVTAGTFFHTFVQTVMVGSGILARQPVVCGCSHRHPERAEVYLVDEEAGVRGHCDGVLESDGSLMEFKSMNPSKLGGIPKAAPDSPEVAEWFYKKNRGYWAQAQEYLRMSERRRSIVVIMSMSYPFEMREIHVAYDPAFAKATRDKYLYVRQAVADQRPPRCTCPPTNESKSTCPSYRICWGK